MQKRKQNVFMKILKDLNVKLKIKISVTHLVSKLTFFKQ